MPQTPLPQRGAQIGRRAVIRTAAWGVPAISLAGASPAFADSQLKTSLQMGGWAAATTGDATTRLLIAQGGFGNASADAVPGPLIVTVTVDMPDGGEVPSGEALATLTSGTVEGSGNYPNSHAVSITGSGAGRQVVITATWVGATPSRSGRTFEIELMLHPLAPSPADNPATLRITAPGEQPLTRTSTVQH